MKQGKRHAREEEGNGKEGELEPGTTQAVPASAQLNMPRRPRPPSTLVTMTKSRRKRSTNPITIFPDLYASVVSNDVVKFHSLLSLGVPVDYY